MKRKELEALLVSTIEDIKSVESIDELEINDDQRIHDKGSLEETTRMTREENDDQRVHDEESLEETTQMTREENDDDYYKNNDLPISTILEFLTDETGELEIAKKQKT